MKLTTALGIGMVFLYGIVLILVCCGCDNTLGDHQPEYEVSSEVGVVGVKGTGSMLPLIYPDSKLEYIKFEGEPRCGHIYIYELNGTNNTVVHRFVYEGKNGSIYMKGDSNLAYDKPITNDKILYEIVGIR